MSNIQDSWEDDPAAQDENLARQAQQQMNFGAQQAQQAQGGFRPSAAAFQPTAQNFQPNQPYGGNNYGQYQQPYYGGQGYYPQYGGGGQQAFGQYGQQGYGAAYGQAGHSQGYAQRQAYQQQPQQPQQQQPPHSQAQQQGSKPAPVLAKRAVFSPVPVDAPKPSVAKDGGTQVLSIGSDAKPKAKVLSIGGAAPVKGEFKKEETKREEVKENTTKNEGTKKGELKKEDTRKDTAKKEDAKKEGTAEAAAKVTAAKAIDKTESKAASGKTSPAPSSGRSSPTPTPAKATARGVDAVEKEQEADVDPATLKDLYGNEHVNVIFIGHVDAGKSTLGGAILVETEKVDQRTLDKYKDEAKALGRESWYLSWALDMIKEERAKGKTVEVGRASFETKKRSYSILDAPGHKSYVPSMIGGASQADVGVLVISARKGEFETGFEKGGQTREHAILAKTQGVNKLIVVINKMDDPTVNYSETRYKECKTKLETFLKSINYNLEKDVFFMPVAAQQRLGIKTSIVRKCPWYKVMVQREVVAGYYTEVLEDYVKGKKQSEKEGGKDGEMKGQEEGENKGEGLSEELNEEQSANEVAAAEEMVEKQPETKGERKAEDGDKEGDKEGEQPGDEVKARKVGQTTRRVPVMKMVDVEVDGPTLLEYLDNMEALERKLNAPFMMPVASKYRDMGTFVEGKIEAGVVKKGMNLVLMPNKRTIEVSVVYLESEDEADLAQCGDQTRLKLKGIEEEEILPGFVLCSPKRLVHNVAQFEAQINIMQGLKGIITAGFNCVLHVHAAIEEVTFSALLHKLQKGTGRRSKLPPSHAKKNEAIIAILQVTGAAGSVCVERFVDYPQMGRFTLRDQGQTIAIGKVTRLINDGSAA